MLICTELLKKFSVLVPTIKSAFNLRIYITGP